MANVKVPGILRNKVNNAAVARTAQRKSVDRGVIKVPAGINNGTAQLDKIGFGIYKSGKGMEGNPYFFASGTIHEPETVATPNGVVKVRGLPIRIQIKAYARKGTIPDSQEPYEVTEEQVWETINNEIQLLAECDPKLLQMARNAKTGDDIEAVCVLIEQRKPFFKFSSWARKPSEKDPTPDTMFNFHGCDGAKAYKPVKKGMADGTGTTAKNGTGTSSGSRNFQVVQPEDMEVTIPDEGNENQASGFNAQEDILLLGEQAQGGDTDAQAKLQELIEKYDLVEEAKAQPSWEDTAKLVAGAMGQSDDDSSVGDSPDSSPDDDEGGSPDEPDEKPTPVKGKVYRWFFKDAKSQKRTTKPMLVKITNVDLKKDMADCVEMKNPDKARKGIPFADLEPVA